MDIRLKSLVIFSVISLAWAQNCPAGCRNPVNNIVDFDIEAIQGSWYLQHSSNPRPETCNGCNTAYLAQYNNDELHFSSCCRSTADTDVPVCGKPAGTLGVSLRTDPRVLRYFGENETAFFLLDVDYNDHLIVYSCGLDAAGVPYEALLSYSRTPEAPSSYFEAYQRALESNQISPDLAVEISQDDCVYNFGCDLPESAQSCSQNQLVTRTVSPACNRELTFVSNPDPDGLQGLWFEIFRPAFTNSTPCSSCRTTYITRTFAVDVPILFWDSCCSSDMGRTCGIYVGSGVVAYGFYFEPDFEGQLFYIYLDGEELIDRFVILATDYTSYLFAYGCNAENSRERVFAFSRSSTPDPDFEPNFLKTLSDNGIDSCLANPTPQGSSCDYKLGCCSE